MVKCADCGFLTKPGERTKAGFPEVTELDRGLGFEEPICYRNEHDIQWEYGWRVAKLPGYDPESQSTEIVLTDKPNPISIGRDIIDEERKCDEFIRYQPNNDPVWHRDEAGRAKDRKSAKWQVCISVAALFAALVLIVVTLLAPLMPYWTGLAK